MAKRLKLKKKAVNFFIYFALIIAFVIYIGINYGDQITANFSDVSTSVQDLNEEIQKSKDDEKLTAYNDCLSSVYSEEEVTDELTNKIAELNSYLKKYSTSVIYEDITTGFSFTYEPTIDYYAASTIKTLDALYIYTKASNGELNLDEQITYSSNLGYTTTGGMGDHKYGDIVTLRELVKNAVTISDNIAHAMLVNYIGKDNLKQFGYSLGAKKTINTDIFGSIDTNDAMAYLKGLNAYLSLDTELSNELKSYFTSSDQNDLALNGISAATKYGEYDYFYHNIGIVYDTNPYMIAILTKEKSGDFRSKVSDINAKVYELHNTYKTIKKNYCENKVYNN